MSGEILKLALVNILNFEFCPDADVWLKFLSSLYETFIERSSEQLKIARRQQMNVEITAQIRND